MVTSLYLANRNIQAVIGKGGSRVHIDRVCSRQIPEGYLINGVITGETELAEELNTFWKENRLPKNQVELVIGSSQFVTRRITLPKMRERQLREILPLEFADVTGMTDPVIDYMVESENGEKTLTVQAVMAERSFVQNYIELLASIGVKVTAVRVSRFCVQKALRSLNQLKDKTCVVMMMDGSVISSNLWNRGTSVYASQRRVMGEPGTVECAQEIARVLNNMIQFSSTQNLPEKIREVYFAGISEEDFQVYSRAVQEMNLGITPARLEQASCVKVKKNSGISFDGYLPQVGCMLPGQKDVNLAVQVKKKALTEKRSEKWKKYLVAPAICLVFFLGLTGVMQKTEKDVRRQLRELNVYLNDAQNLEQTVQDDLLKAENVQLQSQVDALNAAAELMDTYPQLSSDVLMQIQEYAKEQKAELQFCTYQAAEGALLMEASAAEIEQIHAFLEQLEQSGLFAQLQYPGYEYKEKEELYEICVTGYFAGEKES